jgi:hypothetical protein
VPPIPGISADRVEIGNHFRGNPKRRSLKVLAKMLDGRCSGDDQDIVRPLEKPGKRNLHGRGTEARGDVRQGRRLEWSEAAEWKEWHVGNPVTTKISYERIIGSMCEVVVNAKSVLISPPDVAIDHLFPPGRKCDHETFAAGSHRFGGKYGLETGPS